ncbi:MAG TPA: XRE family transcriptional regulator [Geminicoccus sp.]|uniref:helix-turn-helix domain-containing protein n=1 Tax=Geminicoccus sp. TaxID=2024832 RepID=UPI002C96387C|nr:XRE family transcriptional regulator [Geminicoccus sp.]HWL71642.1 XRE family transcriptional regulator [Geminicoccus sp.]
MSSSAKKPTRRRSTTPAKVDPHDPGPLIQRLRREKNLLLSDLAKLSGVSASTISRIENGKISPTYGVMAKLSEALGVPWADLISTSTTSFAAGCRAVSRADGGVKQKTARGIYEWLGTDLVTKAMLPIVVEALPDHPERVLEGQSGEELLYVLEGTVIFYMQHYAPLVMEPGDSVYFDAGTPHAAYARDGRARFLSVTFQPR